MQKMKGDFYYKTEPATVNLDDETEVIDHLRCLHDLRELLLRGYEEEMELFLKMLSTHGWSKDYISRFIEMSGYGTRYEELIDSPIRNRGSRREFDANYHRWRK